MINTRQFDRFSGSFPKNQKAGRPRKDGRAQADRQNQTITTVPYGAVPGCLSRRPAPKRQETTRNGQGQELAPTSK